MFQMTDLLAKNVRNDTTLHNTTAKIDTNQGDTAKHEAIRNDTDTVIAVQAVVDKDKFRYDCRFLKLILMRLTFTKTLQMLTLKLPKLTLPR